MFRVLPILFFVVCATLATSVDAQLFRRFFVPAPQAPAVRADYEQVPQARFATRQQLQLRQSQYQEPQQACYQQQMEQLRLQQMQLQQTQLQQTQLQQRQRLNAAGQTASGREAASGRRGQRYQVYYNPRTNRTYLQAVGPQTPLGPQALPKSQQPQPTVVGQVDVARQASRQSQASGNGPALNGPALNGPALNGPSLNGPALSGPAVVQPLLNGPLLDAKVRPVSGIEPATAAPTANVITANKIPAQTSTRESAAETDGSFSVLEGSKEAGSILEKDPGSLDVFGDDDN